MNLFTTSNFKRQGNPLASLLILNNRYTICLLLILAFSYLGTTHIVNASTPQQRKKTKTKRVATRKTTSKKHIPTFDEYLKEHGTKEPEVDLEGIDLSSLDLSAVTGKKANWTEAASSDDYLILYSPKRLIRLSKNIVRVWTRSQNKDTDKYDGFMLELNEYNCETKMTRTLRTAMYDKSGHFLINTLPLDLQFTPDAAWDYVLPDTLEEEELDTVCKNAPQNKK